MLRHERMARKAGFKNIAGIDEAGRGPLAGPLVAASVILKVSRFRHRIDDSKKLTPNMRECAYAEILRKAHVGIGVISEKTVDRINVYNATKKAMEQSVKKLSLKPDFLLIDGTVKFRTACRKAYITGGDSKSLSIACASIIAKVTRDGMMRQYHKKYPEYGFARHKGYGTKEHIRRLKIHGPSPIHRRSFSPIKDLILIKKERPYEKAFKKARHKKTEAPEA